MTVQGTLREINTYVFLLAYIGIQEANACSKARQNVVFSFNLFSFITSLQYMTKIIIVLMLALIIFLFDLSVLHTGAVVGV